MLLHIHNTQSESIALVTTDKMKMCMVIILPSNAVLNNIFLPVIKFPFIWISEFIIINYRSAVVLGSITEIEQLRDLYDRNENKK